MKTYIAFDPGKDGAIAAIYPNGKVRYNATPQLSGELDEHAFAGMFSDYLDISADFELNVIVGVEDVHSIYGSSAKSNFNFGVALGIIKGILALANVPHIKVPPKTWQKAMFAGIAPILLPAKEKGKGTYDTKAMALIALEQRHPGLDLRKNSRCRTPHDGIVDALLIAEYLKTKY